MSTNPTLDPQEVNRVRRGHRFYPSPAQLVKVPRTYATDEIALADKVIHLHYFGGACDWWLAEYDPENQIGFGYVCLGDSDLAEWGYVDLKELETLIAHQGLLIIERDCHWTPRRASEANLPGRAAL